MTSSSASASTSMLTLKYAGAVVATLLAVYYVVALLPELFGLWTGKGGYSTVLSTGYVSMVTTVVAAVLFSVLSFLLYKNVTKGVASQPDYVNKSAYHFITNGFFAVLAVAFVVTAAEVVSVLVSSLLLIGTSTDIGGLYLNQFLPGVLEAGVVGFVGFTAFKIMKGKNMSTIMTIVLMSLAGALMLAALITIPIKAHSTSSSTPSSSLNDYNFDYDSYFNNLKN